MFTARSHRARLPVRLQPVPLEDRLVPTGAGPTIADALTLPSGQVVSLIPTPRAATTAAVGFVQSDTGVTAYDQSGHVLWSHDLGAGHLFGGFDFNQDGIPDLAMAYSVPTGRRWGGKPIEKRWLGFFDGATGAAAGTTKPLVDRRWTFPGAAYPTPQWATNTLLFGSGPTVLASPEFATTSWFLNWQGGQLRTTDALYFPSTAAYDQEYPRAAPNPVTGSTDYVADSHVGNGLIVHTNKGDVAVVWTSDRVVQYRVGPLGPGQVVRDDPYLNGGRTDLGGRNYGLVAQDPNDPDHIALLAGTSAMSLYTDAVTGKRSFDPWGGIERHVDLYSVSGRDRFQHDFFGSAHDYGDEGKYAQRLVFPANPFLTAGPGSPSRLVYNVFNAGHWYLHISKPGSLADAVVIPNAYVWDVRDLTGTGQDDLIISPTPRSAPGKPKSAYFPEWTTVICTWNEGLRRVIRGQVITAGIPQIIRSFRTPTVSSSEGYLYPAAVTDSHGQPQLVVTSRTGQTLGVNVSLPSLPGPYYPRFSPTAPDFTAPDTPAKRAKRAGPSPTPTTASRVAADPPASNPVPVLADLFVPVAEPGPVPVPDPQPGELPTARAVAAVAPAGPAAAGPDAEPGPGPQVVPDPIEILTVEDVDMLIETA